jgi:quercetin dioxygenase-like cupin family protein
MLSTIESRGSDRAKAFVLRVTGKARIDRRPPTTRLGQSPGTHARFEPGARTAWHTNPRGQTLIVKEGCGRMQCWGQPFREIQPGDVVSIAPGEKHWHGASPESGVVLFTVQAALDGASVTCLEDVSEAEYLGHTQEHGTMRVR